MRDNNIIFNDNYDEECHANTSMVKIFDMLEM